ncbi:hypothetical protein B0A54_03801 [Friedmanniomyces endolithicus]|uniref:Uncharacterized protein n=1 Tax=Friedmanniomyces endolithicus TaxID=329885 RepID=A0A4U0VFC2_9PEZI|nr:hypothetical protein B0A54_03801 [Friedmanniomyces endolithicus]
MSRCCVTRAACERGGLQECSVIHLLLMGNRESISRKRRALQILLQLITDPNYIAKNQVESHKPSQSHMSTLSTSPVRHSTLSSRIVKAHGLSTEKMQDILQGYEAALRIANQFDEQSDDFTEGEQTCRFEREEGDARRERLEAKDVLREAEIYDLVQAEESGKSREEGDARRERLEAESALREAGINDLVDAERFGELREEGDARRERREAESVLREAGINDLIEAEEFGE